jgi:SAM-dependent methyltransferase
MFTERAWENAPREVEQALELLGVGEGAEVLDLCCGPGRHSLELARRGYRVTAVDRTAEYLEMLAEATEAEGLAIEVVHEDMRRFRREGAFDAVVNLFTSFGYFEDQDDDRAVAANMRASLRPGGRLLMELMSKEILARIFDPRRWQWLDEDTIKLEETEVTRNWTWVRTRWILLRGSERTERVVEHRIYSAAELMALLEQAGFGEFEVFGGLEGAPYDHEAKRLVVLARAI